MDREPGALAGREPGEAERIRAAYARRGNVELGLVGNPGQVAIVAERDEAITRALASVAQPVGRLLDLGCGYGQTLGRLVADGLVLDGVGVDVLAERIEVARGTWPRLEFQVASGGRLPFTDGAFDAVLAMTTFSSIPKSDRRAVLLEVARVLRPGGAFVWYDLRIDNPRNRDVSSFRSTEVAAVLPEWTIRRRTLTLLPPLARRLGRLAPPLYRLLVRVPALRTHEVGVARKPPPGRFGAGPQDGQSARPDA